MEKSIDFYNPEKSNLFVESLTSRSFLDIHKFNDFIKSEHDRSYRRIDYSNVKIGETLKVIRKVNSINQKEMSKIVGVSQSYLSEIESGKKEASKLILEKYSEEFGIPISYIYMLIEVNSDESKLFNILKWISK